MRSFLFLYPVPVCGIIYCRKSGAKDYHHGKYDILYICTVFLQQLELCIYHRQHRAPQNRRLESFGNPLHISPPIMPPITAATATDMT